MNPAPEPKSLHERRIRRRPIVMFVIVMGILAVVASVAPRWHDLVDRVALWPVKETRTVYFENGQSVERRMVILRNWWTGERVVRVYDPEGRRIPHR